MNTTIQNQPVDAAAIAVHLYAVSEVKCCSNCSNELTVNEDIRHTSFGLELCEDCLYM
jgi:hypothetical protein